MTCTWEPDPACLGDSWEGLDDAVKQRSLMLATSSLQMLTNYRVGLCPETIRPCPQPLHCGCGGWNPVLYDGMWFNECPCRARCLPLSEVDLPGPVGYVDSIKVNGTNLDLTTGDFRLDDGHLIVWQGLGPSPIPVTQNLNKPDSEPGTWSITYSRSYPVTAEGRIAVALLAMEFAEACKPRGKCSLPKGVTNVVRAGVSFNIETGLFPGGLTGIQIVDAFIVKWAPAGSPTSTATVFDPSRMRNRARVTSALRVSGNPPPTLAKVYPSVTLYPGADLYPEVN